MGTCSLERRCRFKPDNSQTGRQQMHSLIYLIGLVVVVLFILSILGLA
jgi:hypothetical protein